MLLDGRVAVITGAAAGIGLDMAGVFAREGASVVVDDIDGAAAAGAAASIEQSGGRACGVQCDVTEENSVTALAAAATDAYGSLDVWVNNAGFTRDAVLRKMTLQDFGAVLQVHVTGAWLGLRAATATMREQGSGGSIVNMSSISGKVGNPGQTNYSTAKAAIVGLTKSAAKEVARYGIRVNAIQPGLIDTAMAAKVPADVLAARIAEIPLGRIGRTADVANAALFLAGDLSSYITGVVLEVTGGRHM